MADVIELPVFESITQTQLSQDRQLLRLRFSAQDGGSYDVTLTKEILGTLVTALLARADELGPAPEKGPFQTAPLSLTGVQPIVGPKGEVGVALVLNGGLRLSIPLPTPRLGELQAVLAHLAGLAAPPTQSRH